MKDQLYQYSGRVWYTGKKTENLTSQAIGKNSVSKIPHEIAALLKLADPSKYTFHSFRRTMICSRMLESPARETLMGVGLASNVW